MSRKVRIAIVGMGFGCDFVDLYRAHPAVEHVGLCDADEQRLNAAAQRFSISRTHRSLAEVVASPDYDAVHVLTRVDQHADHCLAVLRAGKHCASAVPMGMTLDELAAVHATQRRTGLVYMMMETAVYTKAAFRAKELVAAGELGELQYLEGYHSQDLDGYPEIWRGFPPMGYITHALAPLLDIAQSTAASAICLGSGVAERGRDTKFYAHPVPIATALFRLRGRPLTAHITRTLFDVATYGGEAFNVWGTKATFITAGAPVIRRIGPVIPGKCREETGEWNIGLRPRPDLLPPELAPWAEGGHEGSHPHLVHEFVSSIIDGRASAIDAARAANWCAPGICAHASMLADGTPTPIPLFT